MQANKLTLTAATPKKLATGGVDSNTLINTALTDLYLGASNVTSDGAASFSVGTITVPLSLGPIDGELWGISAAGGVVYVLTQEAG